ADASAIFVLALTVEATEHRAKLCLALLAATHARFGGILVRQARTFTRSRLGGGARLGIWRDLVCSTSLGRLCHLGDRCRRLRVELVVERAIGKPQPGRARHSKCSRGREDPRRARHGSRLSQLPRAATAK